MYEHAHGLVKHLHGLVKHAHRLVKHVHGLVKHGHGLVKYVHGLIENFIEQQLTEVFTRIKKHNQAQRLVSIVVL